MLCQFQKTTNYLFFGSMKEKNVLSVPKSLYNCCFLELYEKYLSGKFQIIHLGGTLSTI